MAGQASAVNSTSNRSYMVASLVNAVRTTGDPLAIVNAVRLKERDLDKDLAVGKPNTLGESLGEETRQPRLFMALFSTFAALGLTLAAFGIYSVIAYNDS